jgi:ribosomal protein L19E
MTKKKLFDKDDALGITRIWHYDEETDKATIETRQDVSSIIEMNKIDQTQSANNGWKGEWHHVARIPDSIYYKLKAEGKLDDAAYMKRWLNDPDNRFFRVKEGQL